MNIKDRIAILVEYDPSCVDLARSGASKESVEWLACGLIVDAESSRIKVENN